MALLADAQPSRSVVWVLQRLASRASIAGQHERALEIVTRTRALAEQLGWEAGLSEALSLLGSDTAKPRRPVWARGHRAGRRSRDRRRRIRRVGSRLQRLGGRPADSSVTSTPASQPGSRESESPSGSAPLAGAAGSRACWSTTATVAASGTRRYGPPMSSSPRSRQDRRTTAPSRSTRSVPRCARPRATRPERSGMPKRALAAGRALDDPQALFFVLAGCTHVFVLESENDRAARARTRAPRRTGPRRRVAVRRHQPPHVRVRPRHARSGRRSSLDALAGQLETAVDGGSARLCAGRFRGRRRDPAPNRLEAGGSGSPPSRRGAARRRGSLRGGRPAAPAGARVLSIGRRNALRARMRGAAHSLARA